MASTTDGKRGFGPLERLRQRFARDIEAAVGRHDEAAIYEGEPGDPGLTGGPGSMSWEIHGDLASLVLSGTAAILMEVLHPSVMHGVFTQSSYRTDPLRRARNTLGYVLRTTFGSTPAALGVIERVKAMHGRVGGTRADGIAYRALDPELIAWVHTCIPWAVMTGYERMRRPLSVDEKNRYLQEQAVIGRLGGADWVPETVCELEEYVERMRPQLAMNDQFAQFLGFVAGRVDAPEPVGRRELLDRWFSIRASMGLMPEWARRMTGTYVPDLPYRWLFAPSDRWKAALVRWVVPELACKRIALARATARPSSEPVAVRFESAEGSSEMAGRAAR
ncbi:MAG: DUF2236 domain-containing protein [Proteobacteria bacterium]|nr:DUF2236 domain-containing protein [Pseudomonadota bacterium]